MRFEARRIFIRSALAIRCGGTARFRFVEDFGGWFKIVTLSRSACDIVSDENMSEAGDKVLESAENARVNGLYGLSIFDAYRNSPYLSIKHSSYFQVYADLFDKYRGRPVTFVEIGVLNGGSLFMWREYFGPQARIIGVDLNPEAKRWQMDGFAIHIGNQGDPEFWREFFLEHGSVDLILDDGGHTYEQQVVTAWSCIPHINDGGLLVVEDTHTSYFREFGYPTKYSFLEWTKKLADNINCRFPSVNVSRHWFNKYVYSLTVFESIVSFSVDRRKCFISEPTSNNALSLEACDFRYKGTRIDVFVERSKALSARVSFLRRIPGVKAAYQWFLGVVARKRLRKIKKYF